MVKWIAKASQTISRETEGLPQEFRLSCECGQTHHGQRKSRSQRIICQTCGSALFVLPRNVYPTLPPLKSKRRRGKKRSARNGALPSLGRFTRGVGRATSQAGRSLGRAVSSTAGSLGRWLASAAASLVGMARAQITPFRLVLGGIATVLMVTVAVSVHNRVLERARETLRVEIASGEEALQNADALAAREHFENAALAANRLGSTDTRSRLAQQMLHETTAMTQLAPASLAEILEEAERLTSSERPELWEDRFRATYAGTWLLFDAPIHRHQNPGEESAIRVDIPLVVGVQERPVSVTVRVSDHAVTNLVGETSQRAIFAASLSRCELDSTKKRWIVALNGQSGFLWSSVDTLRSLGFLDTGGDSEQETAELLEAQSEALGLQ